MIARLRAIPEYLRACREFFHAAALYAYARQTHQRSSAWSGSMLSAYRRMINARRVMRTGRAV